MSQIDKYRDAFKDEAYELLGELEAALLELEESPDDKELVGRVFRAMHTIKGSGAMFGFNDIADFMHNIENVFDKVRNGEIAVTKELIKLSLSARDQIRVMLDAYSGGDPVDETENKDILESFQRLVANTPEEETQETQETPADSPSTDTLDENVVYRIHLKPSRDLLINGTNPISLLNELRELGECHVVAYVDKIPPLDAIDPELCYTYWDIILTTRRGIDAIKDVFIFIDEESQLDIKVIDGNSGLDDETDNSKLGQILLGRGAITEEELQNALASQKRLGEILEDSGAATGEHIQSALIEQEQLRKARKKRQHKETTSSIRVPTYKLDHFVDLVGELVIIQQRLSQTAVAQNNPELFVIAEEVERLTVELRDSAFSVRMVPIGTTFNKLKRLVHDLSNELGREVEMITDGGETELDKTVIDQLNDPLVHIIRNSIDHGLEAPEGRQAAGKPTCGTVHLSATHSGSNVLIQIRDDGRGIDSKAIRAKAIEKGLIAPDAELSEKECLALVFAPGFSSAKEVTSVSGRGVGMDVVKQTIDMLRGSVDVKSRPGAGTTITITLPLTMAIIEGLLVMVRGENFVLPLSMVEECVELTPEDMEKSRGRHLVNVRGEIVPYIRLREWFQFSGEETETEQVVIARMGGRRVGFVVDRVIGEHQTVIKTLGKVYKNIQGISGATILGDGRVAMIIDIPQLIQTAEEYEEQAISDPLLVCA